MISSEPDVSIREMNLEDLPQVHQIDRMSFPIPWPERSYQFELTRNPAAKLIVAEDEVEGEPSVVGYLGYWLIADEMHISTIAVHPDQRRRGIGELLIRIAITEARELGAEECTLEVRKSNEPALDLYRKLGFKVFGSRARYYRDNGEAALLMKLEDLESIKAVREDISW